MVDKKRLLVLMPWCVVPLSEMDNGARVTCVGCPWVACTFGASVKWASVDAGRSAAVDKSRKEKVQQNESETVQACHSAHNRIRPCWVRGPEICFLFGVSVVSAARRPPLAAGRCMIALAAVKHGATVFISIHGAA